MELWKRRSAALSYRWGTFNLAEQFQEPRPGFHGELGTNPVTGRLEPLFPEWKRRLRIGLVSLPVVGVFLGLVVMGMAGFYLFERLVSNWHKASGSYFTVALLYLPSIAHIVYTNVLGNIYRNVALQLTEAGKKKIRQKNLIIMLRDAKLLNTICQKARAYNESIFFI